MAKLHLHEEIAADARATRAAVDLARDFAARAGLGEDLRARLAIVVEELVANIVEHGAAPADSVIAVDLARGKEAVSLTIADGGAAFDPTTAGQEDIIPERGGGAGLALVRRWTSGFEYERREGQNIVRLTIPVSAP